MGLWGRRLQQFPLLTAAEVKPLKSMLAALGLYAAVTACAGLPETREAMLSSSGFTTVPVKTAAQKAAFKGLRKSQISSKVYEGKTVWAYPGDPTICTCVYIGDQAAYETYLKKAAIKPPIVDAIQSGNSDTVDWGSSSTVD
jgi:hypothetical protein